MARPGPEKKTGPLSREELEAAALRYLDRFDSSRANLARVLMGYVRKAAKTRDASGGAALVDELVARYVASGLVHDGRFAGTLAAGLRRRGASRQAIVRKLRARGVSDEVAREALGSVDADAGDDPELAAARAFAKRRRLGAHRPEAERAPNRRRDLGALARAGFSLDVARRALGEGDDDDAEW